MRPIHKVIITAAINGGLQTKRESPNLPEQPDEIVETVFDCHRERASIVHIHARGKDGKPTGDATVYQEIADRIRERGDIILNFTTGGGSDLTFAQRVECLKARPDIASLNMGSMVRTIGSLAGTSWVNLRSDIEKVAKIMLDLNIKPEMEVYNHAMFVEVDNLIQKGFVKAPYLINLVLGMPYQGAEPATKENLFSLIRFLPQSSIFNVTATGSSQLPLTTLSMLLGGMVRVGLEDNMYYAKGVLAKSNAQLVARSTRIAKELNLEIASPSEAREILGITR